MSYSKYTNEEILETYNTTVEYGGKTDKAFVNEIQARGGINAIKEAVREKNKFEDEKKRIGREVLQQYNNGVEFDVLRPVISSDIFSPEEVQQVIDESIAKIRFHRNDRKIDGNTLFRAIIGMVVSIIVCTAISFFSIVATGAFYYIMFVFLVLISFVIIRLITGKSSRNVAIFMATVISGILGGVFGYLIFDLIAGAAGEFYG